MYWVSDCTYSFEINTYTNDSSFAPFTLTYNDVTQTQTHKQDSTRHIHTKQNNEDDRTSMRAQNSATCQELPPPPPIMIGTASVICPFIHLKTNQANPETNFHV